MLYDGANPYDAEKALDKVKRLIAEKCKFQIVREAVKRTLAQNSYYHLIVRYWASQYGCSEQEAELDYFKRVCNPTLFYTGECYKDGSRKMRSTSELSSAEMSMAIERFRNWSASVAGIYIPSPDERDCIFHCRQEIERVNEFL